MGETELDRSSTPVLVQVEGLQEEVEGFAVDEVQSVQSSAIVKEVSLAITFKMSNGKMV